jgi:hypothetical protein
MSPWTHTGGPDHSAASASCHRRRAAAASGAGERVDHRHGLRVVRRDRSAAKGAVRACRGPVAGFDRLQGEQELGQPDGERREVVDAVGPSRLAVDPAVDRPWAWKAGSRPAPADRLGDGQGQLRREDREPLMFLAHLGDVAVGAGQPHGQVVAEAEGGVVPAVQPDGHDRKARPLRELLADQRGGQLRVDVGLLHRAIIGAVSMRTARRFP